MIRLAMVVLAAGLLSLPVAQAQPSPKDGKTGAAGRAADPAAGEETVRIYRSIWGRFPADFKWAGFIDNRSAAPKFKPQPNGAEPYAWDQFAALLEQNQTLIKELMTNAQRPDCRFGTIGPAEGVGDLGQLRTSARVLRADASRLWAAKDMDGCVDRLCAMYGLVDHAGGQTEDVYPLTAVGVLQLTNESVRAFAAETKPGASLTKAQAQRLLEALARVEGERMDQMAATQLKVVAGGGEATKQQGLSKEKAEQGIERQRQDLADTKAALEKKAK